MTIENSEHLKGINDLLLYHPMSYLVSETYFTGLYVNPLNLYRTTGDGRYLLFTLVKVIQYKSLA